MTRLAVLVEADRAVAAWGRDGSAAVPVDPRRPDGLAAALRARGARAGAIRLVVGLAHLHVATPELPPLRRPDRWAALRLEPDRYFALETTDAAVALAPGDSPVAFAADGPTLARWIAALADLGWVEAILPAPTLAAATADGTVGIAAGPGETGIVAVSGSRLVSVRRAPAGTLDAPGRSLDGAALARAALGPAPPLDAQLLTARAAQSLAARRTARWVARGAAAVVALAALGATAEWWQLRRLDATRARAEAHRADGEAGAAAQARIAQHAREEALVAALDSAPDPLAVLAALAARLPPDASLIEARMLDGEWRIAGTAARAAALVPALAAQPGWSDVRLVGSTTRTAGGESFTIAFRAR